MQIFIPKHSLKKEYKIDAKTDDEIINSVREIFYPLEEFVKVRYEDEMITVNIEMPEDLDNIESDKVLEEALDKARRGYLEEAIVLMEKSIKLHHGNMPAWRNLGTAFLEKKEWIKARNLYKTALILYPKDVHAMVGLANTYVRNPESEQEDIKTGIEYFRKAIEEDPEEYLAHNNLGAALHSIGRSEEAVESFKKAIQINDRDQRGLLGIAMVYSDTGNAYEARRHFDKVVQIDPTSHLAKIAQSYLFKS